MSEVLIPIETNAKPQDGAKVAKPKTDNALFTGQSGDRKPRLNPYHKLVLMGAYVRLFHKGMPPDVALSIDDNDGVNYSAHINFGDQTIKVCERLNAYDANVETEVVTYTYTKEQVEALG